MEAGNPSYNEYYALTQTIIEEIRKGYAHIAAQDLVLLSHALNKLKNLKDVLERIIGSLEHEDVCQEFTRLSSILTSFILRNEHLVNIKEKVEEQPILKSAIQFAPSSSAGGRPLMLLPVDEINNLRSAGMNNTKIAETLGVSRKTLYRNSWQFNEPEKLNEEELKGIIRMLKAENRRCGEKYVAGHLRAIGKKATQKQVRECLRAVDPIGTHFGRKLKTKRGTYRVEGPNFRWHFDGNEKLQPFKIYVHGCCDGYSRKMFYLHCASNKRAKSVVRLFKQAVQEYGYPEKTRSDHGGENVEIAAFLISRWGDPNCYITGKSVHNVRIERLWGEVNKITERYKDELRQMQEDKIFDLDKTAHIRALHFIFLPIIQKSYDLFLNQWNFHKLRTTNNRSPNELYITKFGPAASPPRDNNDENFTDEALDDDDEREEIELFEQLQQFAEEHLPIINDLTSGKVAFRALICHIDNQHEALQHVQAALWRA